MCHVSMKFICLSDFTVKKTINTIGLTENSTYIYSEMGKPSPNETKQETNCLKKLKELLDQNLNSIVEQLCPKG